MKTYNVRGPVGNIVVPKENLSEKELREFASQIVADPEMAEVWKEKAEKDDIKEVVDWMTQSGYTITEI